MHFVLRFIYQKPHTMRYIFICKKSALYVMFLNQKCIVSYKNALTIRAIISKNKFELFIENWSYSYDKYMIFGTYQRMRAQGKSWAGTSICNSYEVTHKYYQDIYE